MNGRTNKGSLNHSVASYLSDVLAHIFNHHFISSDWLQSKQTPVVDVRLAESDLLLTELDRGNSQGAVT